MILPSSIEAIAFDYGNTIIPFGPQQVARFYAALGEHFAAHFDPISVEKLKELRQRERAAPYGADYREHDARTLSRAALEFVTGREPSDCEVSALVFARERAFLDIVEVDDESREVLARLSERYRLAIVSNYPSSDAIEGSLAKLRLTTYFETIVVSADVGWAKPHPAPFEKMLASLRLPPKHVAFVGDNWLADVQGAKRAGLWMARISRWTPPEAHASEVDHLEPDVVISRLTELL